MTFDFSYDLAALIFIILISWQFFSQRQFPLISNRFFGMLLIMALCSVLSDIFGTFLIADLNRTPIWLAYTVNIFYYMVQLLFPAGVTLYVLGRADITKPRVYLFAALPSLISELVFIVAMPMGLVFRIDPIAGYTYGPFSPITYVCMTFNLILSMVIILRYRSVLSMEERKALYLMMIITVTSAILQHTFPSILFIGLGISLSLTMVYFTIQNPGRMTDDTTQVFNIAALRLYLRSLLVRHQNFHMAALKLHGLHQLNTIYGMDTTNRFLAEFGKFLSARPHIWAFRMSDTRFVLLSSHEESFKAVLYDLSNAEALQQNRHLSLSLCHILPVGTLKDADDALGVIESVLSSQQVVVQHLPFWAVDAAALSAIRREATVESLLRERIPKSEGFELYCQPIYSNDHQRFDSGELLLRFTTPELGSVSPGEFIPVAERNALASAMDKMVVGMAFRSIVEGQFSHLGFAHIQINLSTATMVDEDAVDAILQIAKETGIDTSYVIFEITETTAAFSEELLFQSIIRLSEVGFRFALDDFGTGYASIARLAELPFCMIKLDRTLLSFPLDTYSRIVNIFENLDVDLVAEGVETEEQTNFVLGLGVHHIQGYHFARPMPVANLERFLREA